VALMNSKHTLPTHRYEINVCVCRCCGFQCWRHTSAVQADTVVFRCMCMSYVNVDPGLRLGLCPPGNEVEMHGSGVSCNIYIFFASGDVASE